MNRFIIMVDSKLINCKVYTLCKYSKVTLMILTASIACCFCITHHRTHYSQKILNNHILQLSGYDYQITSLAFSNQGDFMAIAGGDGLLGIYPEPQIIDTRNWIEKYSLPHFSSQGTYSIKYLNNNRLLVCYGSKIATYNSVNGALISSDDIIMLNPEITSNEKLISGLNSHVLTLRDMIHFKKLRSYSNAYGGAISKNGQDLAVGHLGYVLVYSVKTGELIHEVILPTKKAASEFQTLHFSHNDKFLVVNNNSENILVINTKSWKVIKSMPPQYEFGSIFDKSCHHFLVLSDPAILYSTITFHKIKEFPNFKSSAMCAAFIPYTHKIAFGLQNGCIDICQY